LRINTAADDPSGLAISTNLETQVQGFNQASQNVQDANNAAQVALGALTSTTNILQRIRSLAVEAASDINSQNDRANLQTEVSQLLLEVNRIAQNTNFNGQPLLDGSHAGFQAEQAAFLSITANTALATNGGRSTVNGVNFGFLAACVVGNGASSAQSNNATFQTTAGATVVTLKNGTQEFVGVQGLGKNTAGNAKATVDGTIELQVVNTGASIAVQETFIASATGQICVSSTLFGNAKGTWSGGTTNKAGGATAGGKVTINGTGSNSKNGFDNVKITLGNFTSADVGTTTYIKISQNVAALTNPSNPAFNFQSAANEGDVIQVGIQATNTSTLRISNINLAVSSSGNPSLGAEDAIGQIDNALQTLLTQQAQIGAVVIRLNIDQDNDNVAATNLQAAESNIRDLNVGQATTEFTKLQILVQVGTSVLAQSNANAQSVLTLFR
jgi:flagellin